VQTRNSAKRSTGAILPVMAIILTLALVLSVCGYALLGFLAKPTNVQTIEADLSHEFGNIPAIETALAIDSTEAVYIIGLPEAKPILAQPKIASAPLVASAPVLPAQNVPANETANQIQAYLIMRGDTLSAIALNFDVPLEDIAVVNALDNVNLIYTGITVLIPQKPINKVVIKRGETLSALAIRHNTTVADIVKINNMLNPNILYAGQGVIIPGM
jgi:LysM repeat protein